MFEVGMAGIRKEFDNYPNVNRTSMVLQ